MPMPRRLGVCMTAVSLSLLSTALAPQLHAADAALKNSSTPTPVPEGAQPVRPASAHQEFVVLTVDKTSLHADLKTWPEDPLKAKTLKTYRIAVGKEDGDKQSEGDNKTPEGIYFAQNHLDGLPEKYGPRAIPIDFPNPMDHIARKTGHGIWLHGVDHDGRVDEAKVTEGCVVFYNADIASLSTWLRGHQGVVVIAKDASQVNTTKDVAEVRKRTQDWMASWSGRELDQYISFYAPDFRLERMDFSAYQVYKRRVFASYKAMHVTFDNLRVITHPKYAVAFFNQDFHGDNKYNSVGRKVLYWEHSADGNWRIKREVFENRRFEFVTFTDEELALHSEPASGISSTEKEKKAPNL